MPDAQILIIGAGAAGMSAAGALKKQGLDALLLDRDAELGGTWARRYDRLRLHTIRALSGLAHYGMAKSDYPRYPSRDAFVRYLQDYAERFGLAIQLNCEVKQIRMAGEAQRPTWVVETTSDLWRAAVVIIATGYNNRPYTPDWPGRADYGGQFMHASAYKSGRDLAGKRVLVVGSGNTGTEICADLAEQGAALVANSIRTPPMVVPRDPFGLPIHALAIPVSFLPVPVADWLARAITRLRIGDLSKHGMKPPAWQIFKDRRIPIIDVGYVGLLKAGQIHIRENLASFTPGGVVYSDGSSEDFDAVIAATGYRTGLQKLLDLPGLLDEEGYVVAAVGGPTPYGGLYFVGLENSPAGILMAARMASKKLAPQVAAYLGATT